MAKFHLVGVETLTYADEIIEAETREEADRIYNANLAEKKYEVQASELDIQLIGEDGNVVPEPIPEVD